MNFMNFTLENYICVIYIKTIEEEKMSRDLIDDLVSGAKDVEVTETGEIRELAPGEQSRNLKMKYREFYF